MFFSFYSKSGDLGVGRFKFARARRRRGDVAGTFEFCNYYILMCDVDVGDVLF